MFALKRQPSQLIFIFILFKMSLIRAETIKNRTVLVLTLKKALQEQYSATASINTSVNAERRNIFSVSCDLLNKYDNVSEGYCPYMFDKVTCWPSTPPNTTLELPCVTWPFEKTVPGQTVMRTCSANGSWIYNSSSEAFHAMYKHCKDNCDSAASMDQESALIKMVGSVLLVFIFARFHFSSIVRVGAFQLIESSRLAALAGYVVSMIALVVAIAIFVGLRKLHCRRNSIHLHCFVSFFFRALLCITETTMSMTKKSVYDSCANFNSSFSTADQCFLDTGIVENWPCKLFSLLWNFAIISNYFWILVEGLYLHNIIYFSVFQETRITLYVLFGWGTPILIMIPWTVVRIIYDNTICWISYCNLNFLWILRAPVGLAVVVNLFMFYNIIRELYTKLTTDTQFSDQSRYRKLAKSTLILITILGVHYIVFDLILLITNGGFSDNNLSSIIVHCISVVVNSPLGLVVAYVYCFCNQDVRTELQKRWKEWRLMKRKTMSSSHNSTSVTTCDHMKKPQRIFNSNVKLKQSRSFLGLRRKATTLNGCNECQIRLQLLNNRAAMSAPSGHGDFFYPEGTSTQCSTVVNSAQNTLTKSTGRRFVAAAGGGDIVVGQRTNYLSQCWEDNESLDGSGSNAISPVFVSVGPPEESNSDEFVTCSDIQLPAAFRHLHTDCSAQKETIYETES